MGALGVSPWAIWIIAAGATAGVILRPFSWPEYVWAVSGAALLVIFGLLPWTDALTGIGRGTDVYLFLGGMMLLAELARQEGLFDWLAAQAARHARGSAARLFAWVYGVGILVTMFLSNDATAVVLTPAVAAVARTARAEPLPHLFACAFIANAASFVLPISNPANLVIYGSHLPPLTTWLPRYALPSLMAVLATYVALRLTQRQALRAAVRSDILVPRLSSGGRTAALGISLTAVVLLTCSGFGVQLGLPTFLAGSGTAALVLWRDRRNPLTLTRDIAWGILPLVAGLFVLVEALERTGLTQWLAGLLHALVERSALAAAWVSGLVLALVCNLTNNLPAGLVAGRVVGLARVPEQVRAAVLIAVDLGPNLSVTGSLATILWLAALRREGQEVGARRFLQLGICVMTPALLLALASALCVGR